jgi:hypothetical protein
MNGKRCSPTSIPSAVVWLALLMLVTAEAKETKICGRYIRGVHQNAIEYVGGAIRPAIANLNGLDRTIRHRPKIKSAILRVRVSLHCCHRAPRQLRGSWNFGSLKVSRGRSI